MAIVARLLQNQDESGGLVIGDLIIHLLRRAGEAILPVLPELLQAMVNRMTTAKTATFLQVSSSIDIRSNTVLTALTESRNSVCLPDIQSTGYNLDTSGIYQHSRALWTRYSHSNLV